MKSKYKPEVGIYILNFVNFELQEEQMLSETDKYLLESIRAGDYKAFEVLFTSYFHILCRYARSFVRSNETAEDLVADLFMKLWERPVAITVNYNLKSYLFRAVHNSCLNYLDRTHREHIELDNSVIESLNKLVPEAIDDDQLAILMISELEEAIDKSVSLLPEECKKIFLLSRKDGFSHREIANKLGISENTVKVQIYRALSKLKLELKSYL